MTLPTIIADLEGHEFVWVGGAYTLGSTAFLPLSGEHSPQFNVFPSLTLNDKVAWLKSLVGDLFSLALWFSLP